MGDKMDKKAALSQDSGKQKATKTGKSVNKDLEKYKEALGTRAGTWGRQQTQDWRRENRTDKLTKRT